jgi:hypothetical protein
MAHGEYLLILGPLYLLLHFLASLAELFRQYRSRVESKREWNSKENIHATEIICRVCLLSFIFI